MKRSEKAKREKNRIFTVRARARQLLFSGGNYITLVLAVMLCVPPAVLAYFLAAMISEFTLPWVPTAMLAILVLLLFAPIALCTVRVAISIYCGGEAPLSELFYAFSSPRAYASMICLALLQTVKLAAMLLPPVLTFVLVDSLTIWCVAALAAIVVYGVMIKVMSPLYGTLFYTFIDGGVSIKNGLKRSVGCRRMSTSSALGMGMSTLLFVILSALLLCLPLLLYTVPYLICRYVYYMAHADDGELPKTLTEEINETGDINNEQH